MGDSGGPEVRTAAGVVRGRREDGLAVFRGIPFAAPPVGGARFAAPRPAPPWEGVRPVVDFGPPPPQDLGVTGSGGSAQSNPGDDWLTVNVWSPDPGARLPVFVWVYGGAYRVGFSGSPGYDARRIAAEGGVVVVSFNYRLGVEGFARIAGAPANRGLLDQVAALTWVRENIAAFGGDPGRVTVCGESAGAGSVTALLAMPRAGGLFHRAIAQSVPGVYLTDELAEDVAAAIAEEAGLPPTAAALSTVEPWALTAAGAAVSAGMTGRAERWGALAHSLSPFAPSIDAETLPATPWQALADGAARDVEVVLGHNRDEFRLFTTLSGRRGTITAEEASTALRVFGPGADPEGAYRAAFPDATAEDLHELVQSDWLFRMPTLHLADAQAAGGGRVHVYDLTWQPPGPAGACHGLDGPLLFGTFAAHLGPLLLGPSPTPEAHALATHLRTAWTSFARTGDPGWPAYDTGTRTAHLLDVPASDAPYPEEASRRIWADHTFTALPLTP